MSRPVRGSRRLRGARDVEFAQFGTAGTAERGRSGGAGAGGATARVDGSGRQPGRRRPTTSPSARAPRSAANQITAPGDDPGAVRETDALLLFVTSNKALGDVVATPAGWTRVGSRLDGTDTETILYSKVAAANDAGRSQAVDFTATTKATLTLLAYDGTAAEPDRRLRLGRRDGQPDDAHDTRAPTWRPPARTSCPTGPTSPPRPPAGPSRPARPSAAFALGIGAGRITSVASDPNAAAPIGASPGRTATASVSSGKATMWTVVLQADQTANPNVAPVASFTASCPTATCTVDASGSTDTAPGTVASYAWDFGDGGTGTGVSTTHTYTTSGTKTITLTVTDNQGLTNTDHPHGQRDRRRRWGVGDQPMPGHTRLVPDQPRNNTPRISSGEIWDIEVVGRQLHRVFIAGSFTSLANTDQPARRPSTRPTWRQLQPEHRPDRHQLPPDLRRRRRHAVEASPDGTKLFVGGSFNTVNGVAKQKVASLNLTTGAPLTTFGFTNSTNNQVPVAGRHQLHRCTSAAGSPASTACSRPAWPR